MPVPYGANREKSRLDGTVKTVPYKELFVNPFFHL